MAPSSVTERLMAHQPNRVAKSIVESQRGLHRTHVFARVPPKAEPQPLGKDVWHRVEGGSWARRKWASDTASRRRRVFGKFEPMTLKHTFGRQLRAAGASFEDRQDLLGHKSGRITTHYSRLSRAA